MLIKSGSKQSKDDKLMVRILNKKVAVRRFENRRHLSVKDKNPGVYQTLK